MFIQNFAPGERSGGEYTGNPLTAALGGFTPVTQPEGPNNPAGNTPGIPVMSITAAAAAVLEGPQ